MSEQQRGALMVNLRHLPSLPAKSCAATGRRIAAAEVDMGGPFLSDNNNLGSMAALLLGDLLCFLTFLGSHPVYLAYLLFFSPYLLAALSFLGPLLLSTCFLLLTSLLTVSPYFMGSPPPPPDPPSDGCGRSSPAQFASILRLLLDILDPGKGGDDTEVRPPWPLSGIASELQACVESVEEMYRERGEGIMAGDDLGNPGGDHEEEEEIEEKRIIAETISGNELFGWEMEAIGKLYKARTYEVEEFPVKLAAPRSFLDGGDLLPPATGFHVVAGETGEDLPRTEALSRLVRQSRDCKMPTFEREDVEILPENASNSGDIKSRDRRRPVSGAAPADCVTGDGAPAVPKRSKAIPKSEVVSRPDSDGFKLLRRSSSTSAAAFGAPGSGLSRVASSGEWRWGVGSGDRLPPLSSSGSMRKEEKEWKRTLACKLYEERMVADGGEEGMDLLWETYEGSSGKEGAKSGDGKRGKGTHSDQTTKVTSNNGEHEGSEEEEEEEEEMVGKLCCLQALRFSTAKMGFGLGKSGLLKASKAMKGVGVFRRALRSSRKGREQRAEG